MKMKRRNCREGLNRWRNYPIRKGNWNFGSLRMYLLLLMKKMIQARAEHDPVTGGKAASGQEEEHEKNKY